jgi:hypothetical protein
MSELLYKVGDRVLASRAQDGENHEEGTVVDAHSLIIGEETRPIVVVLFEDGKREYFTATEPDILPVVSEEEEAEPAEEAENGEPVDDG